VASIDKTRNGHWRARYRDPDGRSRSRTFPTKGEANRFLQVSGADMQRGTWVDPIRQRALFDDWAQEWWDTTVHLRPTTRHGYRSALSARVLPTFSGRSIGSIERVDVRKWISGMVAAGYAPKSIRQAVSVLRLILELAVESRALTSNPASRHKLPRALASEPIFLTAEQVNALAASVREPYGFLITFAAYTGLRPSELCGLRVRRLDLLRGTVEVAETLIPMNGKLLVGPTKNFAKRSVPLPPFLREQAGGYFAALDRTLAPDDYVFPGLRGGPLNRDSLHKWLLQPAVRAAGLPPRMRTHDLRHTCASLLIALGAHPKAIQDRLGHSDIRVTLNTYGHLFPSLEESLTDRLDALYRSAEGNRWAPARSSRAHLERPVVSDFISGCVTCPS